LAENNHRHINQITLFTIGATEPPCLFRIIDNIKIQPLANDDTFQYFGEGHKTPTRLAPSQMKAQFGQTGDFAKRFLQMSRIAVQKMPVVLTCHFGDFGSCYKLFSCHDHVSSWKSQDQFNMFKGFYGAAGSQPALPLDNQPRPIGSHALHCAVLNNIVKHKKLALCPRL
jgi:hypothetical protein